MKKYLSKVLMLFFFTVTNCCAASASTNSDLKIELKPKVWFAKINGQMQIDNKVDLQNDLGITNKNLNSLKLSLGAPEKWNFDYDKFSFNGNSSLSSNLDIGKVTYSKGDSLKSDLELKYAQINYMTKPLISADGTESFNLIIGLKYFKYDVLISSYESIEKNTRRDYVQVLPVVGFKAVKSTDKTEYLAQITGIAAGKHGYSYDLDFRISHSLIKSTRFELGYRAIGVKLQSGNEFSKISLNGPYAQICHQF